MDRIFQILAVFALIMLLVNRFIRGRETRYYAYDYIRRFKPPLPAEVGERLIMAVAGAPEAIPAGSVEGRIDMFIAYEGLVFCYGAEGRLTILRQSKVKQELPVPLECTAMALDPSDGTLYFEAAGYIFMYVH
ncbi:MAG TPA: hypothetical protein VG605_00725 [Puia sp.]|nr:hypothetical protein [Puia sp.]